jgi:hypothetical protein
MNHSTLKLSGRITNRSHLTSIQTTNVNFLCCSGGNMQYNKQQIRLNYCDGCHSLCLAAKQSNLGDASKHPISLGPDQFCLLCTLVLGS